MTTVGYGDAYPLYFLGKVIGAVSMCLGILLLALPLALVSGKF